MHSSLRLAWRIAAAAALLTFCVRPLAAQASMTRGIGLFEQRHYPAARRAIEPYAASHPRDARAAYYVGLTYLAEHNTDGAVEWLERAVQLDDHSADYHLNLANAYGLKAMQVGVLRGALLARKSRAEFEAAVGLAPRSVEAHAGLMRFFMLAPGVLGGSRDRALDEAAAIARLNAYAGVTARAAVYRAQNDLSSTAREYEVGIRQFPDSVGLYMALGNTYEQMKRPDASLRVFERLAQRTGREMSAGYQLARLSVITGQGMDRGEALLQRYLHYTPRPGDPPLFAAYWRLGTIYERQGRVDRARASYQAALALNAAFQPARASLANLGN